MVVFERSMRNQKAKGSFSRGLSPHSPALAVSELPPKAQGGAGLGASGCGSRDPGPETLREQNQRVRRELHTLAGEAEKNEAIFRRFHELELALLNAESLRDLLGVMVQGTRETLGLEQVTLILYDPRQEVRDLLQGETLEFSVLPGVRLTDLRVRFGGEEFVVFMIRTTKQDAAGVAERIRRRVSETPIRLQAEETLRVTISGGIAELGQGDRSTDPVSLGASMLERADTALYRAKTTGRDRIVCHGLG